MLLLLSSLLQLSYKILACLHTASQNRVFLCWPSPAPAVEPVCTPLRFVAETKQAAPHQEKAAAPAGGRSETETPGTGCGLHYSGRDRRNNLKSEENWMALNLENSNLFYL